MTKIILMDILSIKTNQVKNKMVSFVHVCLVPRYCEQQCLLKERGGLSRYSYTTERGAGSQSILSPTVTLYSTRYLARGTITLSIQRTESSGQVHPQPKQLQVE